MADGMAGAVGSTLHREGKKGTITAVEVVGALGAAGGSARHTRRGLLAWSGWGTMALVGLQGVTAFLFYFWPRRTSAFGTKISAGSPD